MWVMYSKVQLSNPGVCKGRTGHPEASQLMSIKEEGGAIRMEGNKSLIVGHAETLLRWFP